MKIYQTFFFLSLFFVLSWTGFPKPLNANTPPQMHQSVTSSQNTDGLIEMTEDQAMAFVEVENEIQEDDSRSPCYPKYSVCLESALSKRNQCIENGEDDAACYEDYNQAQAQCSEICQQTS